MSLTDIEILDLITKEFREQTLGATEQYLEIHQPVYEDGIIKIDRIDRESTNDIIIAYLPVEKQYFHFAVYINPNTSEITSVDTESCNIVSLCITSDDLDVSDLSLLKSLTPTITRNKGELRPNKKVAYTYSLVEYEPNPEPDEFEDKLKKLLYILSDNKKDLESLISIANTYIRVIMDFHYGNQLLGSADIDLECIKLLANLNLRIRFEFGAWGNRFK